MSAYPRFNIEQVRAIKQRHEAELMYLAGGDNVIGVGIGLVEWDPKTKREQSPGIVITVKRAIPAGILPTELDGAPVRVMEVGTLRGLGA